MRPTDKAKRLTVVPYSPSLPLKTLDMGILLLAVFTLELETDYPSETSLCTVAPFSTDTPSPIFFSEGKGRLYTGYLERIIPSSNCPSKLKDKVRRIVHAKLKLFLFKLRRITYLTRIIKRITRLTRIIRL